jgi:hypothetical protein
MPRTRRVDGEYREKRSDTLVGTLREEYGPRFAPRTPDEKTLGELKEALGMEKGSLDDVLRHYKIRLHE